MSRPKSIDTHFLDNDFYHGHRREFWCNWTLIAIFCVLMFAMITLAPIVRTIQKPGHDGADRVWPETEDDAGVDLQNEAGPRAPVTSTGITFFVAAGFAVLSWFGSILYTLFWEENCRQWLCQNTWLAEISGRSTLQGSIPPGASARGTSTITRNNRPRASSQREQFYLAAQSAQHLKRQKQ